MGKLSGFQVTRSHRLPSASTQALTGGAGVKVDGPRSLGKERVPMAVQTSPRQTSHEESPETSTDARGGGGGQGGLTGRLDRRSKSTCKLLL